MSDTRQGGRPELNPGAELTIVHAAALREQWLALLAEGSGPLRLDLGEVTDIDSSGVQLLLALQRTLEADGEALQLLRCSRAVHHAFETYGLLGRLEPTA